MCCGWRWALAIDGQGRLYVGDLLPAIKVFDRGGRLLGTIAGADACFGMAVTAKDQVLGCFRNRGGVRK